MLQRAPGTHLRSAIGAAVVLCALSSMVGCASEASYVENGQLYASQRKYDAAIEQYMMAIEENPDSASAHLNLGLVYLALARYPEAQKTIEQARSIEDSDDAIVALSMVHYQQKRFVEAAKLMEQALQRSPDRAMHHYRLGLIRKQAGDLERAVDSFKMAITQDPGLVDARTNLGLALKQLKRFDEALEVLKDAVRDLREADASVSELQAALGEVYQAMALNDYAEHSFKLALKNNPKNGAAIAGLGSVMRSQGNIEGAIEMMTQALRTVPKDAKLHMELGLAYNEFRMQPKALESLKTAVEIDPRLAEAYPPLIELMDAEKISNSQKFKVLEGAAAVMPDDLDVQLRFGKTAYKAKKYEPAIAAFRVALELEPANIDANYYLGMSQAAAGRIDEAVQSANALQYLDPQKAAALVQAIESGAAAADAGDDKASRKKKKRKKKRKKRKKRR